MHGLIGVRLTHSLVYWSNLYPVWHVQILSPSEKIDPYGQAKHVLLILLANGVSKGHVVMLNLVVYANTISLYCYSVILP